MKNNIVVVGSSNVDLLIKTDHLPGVGETVTDGEFFQVYGGKGANQAVAAARSGGKVRFVNCVGEDAYTPQMIRNYEADGIDTRWVFREKGIASGHALIMIGEAGNNYLAVAPGANYRLTPQKITEAMPAFEQAGMILMQYEIPEETIRKVMDLAGEKAIPVLWNFAPARAFDTAYLSRADILVVNEVEAAFLAGFPVAGEEDAERAAGTLMDAGVHKVIVTLGQEGALAISTEERCLVPAFRVTAVDTTAAGDTFCGCLAVALMEGSPLEQAVRFASAAAAISVTRMGAQPSAPTRQEIDAFLEAEGST